MNDDRRLLRELLRLVDRTAAREIDCEEFLHRSAALVEATADAEQLPPGWPDLIQHLSICPECEEEFQALRRAIRGESS